MLLTLLLAGVLAGQTTYHWAAPCDIAHEKDNRVQRAAEKMFAVAGLKGTVVRCVQPEGHSAPVFASRELDDDVTLLIYSEEWETFVSDAGLNGLLAHEFAHQLVECDYAFFRPPTHEEYITCESAVDGKAGELAGMDAIMAAMDEFHRLHIRMVAASLARVRGNMDERRCRLRQDEPEACR